MKIFLLALFALYFAFEFIGSFAAWVKSKTNKEYGLRFIDTVCSIGMILAFIKLVEVLSK